MPDPRRCRSGSGSRFALPRCTTTGLAAIALVTRARFAQPVRAYLAKGVARKLQRVYGFANDMRAEHWSRHVMDEMVEGLHAKAIVVLRVHQELVPAGIDCLGRRKRFVARSA